MGTDKERPKLVTVHRLRALKIPSQARRGDDHQGTSFQKEALWQLTAIWRHCGGVSRERQPGQEMGARLLDNPEKSSLAHAPHTYTPKIDWMASLLSKTN